MNAVVELDIPTGEPTIIVKHWVDAPAQLVFDAWTKTEHLTHWWGPREQKLTTCEVDLRIGGSWRFVSKGPDGVEHGFHGVYREIAAPNRLVMTWVYEGAPEHEAVDVVTFDAADGGTMIAATTTYQSLIARDMHVASGMESGMRETFDRLDEFVAAAR
jgi:uncharacterized protein YndB with AHSA1/START domain